MMDAQKKIIITKNVQDGILHAFGRRVLPSVPSRLRGGILLAFSFDMTFILERNTEVLEHT